MGIQQVKNDYAVVKINIGNNVKNVKIEKGCVFENNGGQYAVDKNGILSVFDKDNGAWKPANAIKMTNYQMNVFKAVANNNDEGTGITLSQKDIQIAQEKFKKGGFTADMSEFLTNGYKITKPKMSTADKYVQAYVTNGKLNQSATLKFGIADNLNIKPSKGSTKVDMTNLKLLDSEGTGNFKIDVDNFEDLRKLPFPITNYNELKQSTKAKLSALNGQKITPELADRLVNILIDSNRENEDLTYTGEGIWTTSTELADIARFADYLKPATLDRVLKELSPTIHNGHAEGTGSNEKDVKRFYDKLNPQQKQLYYSKLLSRGNNIDCDIYSNNQGDYQTSGIETAKLIFEEPVSNDTYNKLKNFVKEMNQKNGIRNTRSECSALINTLEDKGQITSAQAAELRRIATLNR